MLRQFLLFLLLIKRLLRVPFSEIFQIVLRKLYYWKIGDSERFWNFWLKFLSKRRPLLFLKFLQLYHRRHDWSLCWKFLEFLTDESVFSFLLSIEVGESFPPRTKVKKERGEIFRCLIRIMRKVFEIFDRLIPLNKKVASSSFPR